MSEIRRQLAAHDCFWNREPMFPSSDEPTIGRFRRKRPGGGEIMVVADVEPDELIDAETLDQWLRGLGLKAEDVHIENEDGETVSVRPPKTDPPPPPAEMN